MYKSENDRTEKFGIAETGTLQTNSNAMTNVLTINTDATAGTLTITARTRLALSFEPVLEDDNLTPVVFDFSATERSINIPFPLKEIKGVPSGLNGTFYELTNCGSGNFQ